MKALSQDGRSVNINTIPVIRFPCNRTASNACHTQAYLNGLPALTLALSRFFVVEGVLYFDHYKCYPE